MEEYKDLLIDILTGSKPLTAKEIADELDKRNHPQTFAGKKITQTQVRRVIRNNAIFIQDKSQKPTKYFIENKNILATKKNKLVNIQNEKGFLNWLKVNQTQISRPDKYIGAVRTISNDLLKLGNISNSIYLMDDIVELTDIHEQYFESPQFKTKDETGNRMYSRGFSLYLEYFMSSNNNKEADDILDITRSENLNETEKKRLISARIGQGKFRDDLIALCGKCSISGYSDTLLLVASHIKPWKHSNNSERLDPYNGLLLLPTYDKLFDKGLISFDQHGLIIISPLLSNWEVLNIKPDIKIKLEGKSRGYMKFHREKVYEATILFQ